MKQLGSAIVMATVARHNRETQYLQIQGGILSVKEFNTTPAEGSLRHSWQFPTKLIRALAFGYSRGRLDQKRIICWYEMLASGSDSILDGVQQH